MIRVPPAWTALLRRAPMLAAFLALALQLMFPAGFMVAEAGQTHGAPIVICTAQGQMTIEAASLPGAPVKKAPPGRSMPGCAFAGHATAVSPPLPQALAQPVAFVVPPQVSRPVMAFPGQGLAAPPPPAIGPPTRI